MNYTKIDAFVLRLVEESTPERTAWNMEKIREGKPASWNYIDGCMLTALTEMSAITGDPRYFSFVRECAGHFVRDDGSIRTFRPEAHNLDDINEGRVLFALSGYDEKFRRAAGYLKARLDEQPRTAEGNFWHKQIYPNQVWLDGIYMAQPFRALYERYFGTEDYSDIVSQIMNVREKMFCEEKGLYFHGYDASRTAFWADPETGCSRNFWLRSLGWFAVALADLLEAIPAREGTGHSSLAAIFRELMASAARYADPETGLYWQVPDQGGREGNYLETSGSAMMAYAMLKGARLGVLGKEYATKGKKTFDGIVEKYLVFTEDGFNLGGICLVAGLGPENNRRRDGSYEYYISEPVVENDAKGVAPFVLAYTEVKRIKP